MKWKIKAMFETTKQYLVVTSYFMEIADGSFLWDLIV